MADIRGAVQRTALLDTLRPVAAPTVAFVTAPAGYGKSTLLAQVAAATGRKPFASLTIGERDNDPRQLVATLGAALGIEVSSAKSLGAAIGGAGAVDLSIDDLHLLSSERSLDALRTVAASLPPRSRLLLAGRTRPPDPLAEALNGGRTIELGREDLRMSESEAGALLRSAGVDFPDDELPGLVQRLEGWPAGLYLAALVVKTDGSAVATFDGSDRFVVEYFREECLSALDGDDVRFLERVAVLDQLSGALCDSALRVSGSATRLKQLARSLLFVIPTAGGRSRTYRLHAALRDAVRGELLRREPQLAQAIAARAADWALRQGDEQQAVAYAWGAGREEQFVTLIEQSATGAYHNGGLSTIEQWLSWPRDSLFVDHPALSLWRALVHLLSGDEDEALRWIELAAPAQISSHASIDGTPLSAWRALLMAALCRSGLEEMRVDSAAALEALADDSPWRPSALLLLGVTHVLAGETAAAEEVLSEAEATATTADAKDTLCVVLAQRALIESAEGRWAPTEAFATKARGLVKESNLDDYPTSALTYAASARSAVQHSDWVRARTDVDRATRLLPLLTGALPWLSVQVRVEVARTRLGLSEHDAASTVLAEAEELLAEGLDLGTLRDQVDELRIELSKSGRPDDRREHLTPAELRLLPLLTTHLSFREIAEILHISRNTVKTQAICVYRKLGVSSRSAAIERASKLDLVETPEALELAKENR